MPSTKRRSRSWDSDTEDFSSEDESCRRKPKQRAKERKRKEASTPWSEQEMELLIRLVQERQDPTGSDASVNWGEVSALMRNRNPKQCREKFRNDLRPDISKGPWSAEEDYVLALAHSQLGNKWSDIAQHLPRRAENTIKNHWYATLRSKADNTKTFLWVYATYATDHPTADCLQAAKHAWAELVASSNGTLQALSTFKVQDNHFTTGPGAQHAAMLQQAELQAALQGPGRVPLRSASARAAALAGGGTSSRTKKAMPSRASAAEAVAQLLHNCRQQTADNHKGTLALLPGSWVPSRTDNPPISSTKPDDADAPNQVVVTGTVTVYEDAPAEWPQAPQSLPEVIDASQQAAGGKGLIISTGMAPPHSIPLRPSEGGDASCTVAFHMNSLQPVDDKHTKTHGIVNGVVGSYDVAELEAAASLQAVGYQLHVPLQPPGEDWQQNMSARAGTVTITNTADCGVTEWGPNINLPSPEVLVFAQSTHDDQWLNRGTVLAAAAATPTACHTGQVAPTLSLGVQSNMDGSTAACMASSPAAGPLPQCYGNAATAYAGSSSGLAVHMPPPEPGPQQSQFSLFPSSCGASVGAAAVGQYASLSAAANDQVPAAAAADGAAVNAINDNQVAVIKSEPLPDAPRPWDGGLVPQLKLCTGVHAVDTAQHRTPASSSCPAPVPQDLWPAASRPHSRSGIHSLTVHRGMGLHPGQRTGHLPEQGHVWPAGCHRSSLGNQMQQQAHYPSMYGNPAQLQQQSVHGRRRHQQSSATTASSPYHNYPYVLPRPVPYMRSQLPQQSLPPYAGHLVYQQPPPPPPGQPYLLAPHPYQQQYHVGARAHHHVAQAGVPSKPRHVPMASFTMHGGAS